MNFNIAIKILGLPNAFYLEDLKRVYRKLAKLNHPDLNPNNEEKMKKINQAYEYLYDGRYYKERTEYEKNKDLIDELCKKLGELPFQLRYAYMIACDKGYKENFITWLEEQISFKEYVQNNLIEIKNLLNKLKIDFDLAKEQYEEYLAKGFNGLFVDWLSLKVKENELVINCGLINPYDLYLNSRDNGYTGEYIDWLEQQVIYKENKINSDEIINRLFKLAKLNGFNNDINEFLVSVGVIQSNKQKTKVK